VAPGLPVNTDSRSELQYRATRSLYSGPGLARENVDALRKIAVDPVSRYLPAPLRSDLPFLRLLARRNVLMGDLDEALALVRGDSSDEASKIREEIERHMAPVEDMLPAGGGNR
jgi:hypothetical protein